MRGRKRDQPFIDQVPDGPMDFETLDHLQWYFTKAVEAFNVGLVEKYVERFADVPFIAAKATPRELLMKMNEDENVPWKNKVKTFELLLRMASPSVESFTHLNLKNALAYLIADKKMPARVQQDLFSILFNLQLTQINETIGVTLSGDHVTPLIYAVVAGNLTAVEMLLTRDDLDINFRPEGGEPALIVALKQEGIADDVRKDIVAALMKDERTDPNVLAKPPKVIFPNVAPVLCKSALHIAADKYDAEMMRILNRVDVNIIGPSGTVLHWAVMSRNLKKIKACLERDDLDPNLVSVVDRHTALDLAISMKDEPVVWALLADPRVSVVHKNCNGQNALHHAIESGLSVKLCQAILAKEAQVTDSAKGKEECDSEPKLVTEKISVMDQDSLENTPLVLAAKHRMRDHAKWLLSLHNNDVSVRGYEGKNALHYFALNGDETLVAEFLQHPNVGEVAVNAADAYKMNALHWAACKGHGRVVIQLLDSGKILPGEQGVDFIDEIQETPLMLAAQFCDVTTVKALIKAGADVMRTDDVNQKANEIALEYGKPANASALIEAQIQQGKLGNVSAISIFQPVIATSAKQQEQKQKTAPSGPN